MFEFNKIYLSGKNIKKISEIYYETLPKQYTEIFFSGIKMQISSKKVQVDKDQEKAQSEKDSHSKNQGGKKPN